ncbi:MAG: replication initiation protein [Epsilonproteobacteria bacterium]|nr:replication initiation protein [Campylobacterota bacterium]
MEKKITIHKKNELVRGTDSYSLMAKRALNTIYWAYQKHPQSWKHDMANISFSTLRSMMGLEKDGRYVETIKDALRELREPLELNNFKHPIDNTIYQWLSISFLDEAGFKKNAEGEWLVTVKISRLVAYMMQIEGNFTMLELVPYLNRFRTKYAMKIYEYLQSFKGYKYIDITQKHMMKLLSLDQNSKYRYMSDLSILVERQLKEISKKSDLTEVKLIKTKALAKEKKFRIQINPKSKKEADMNEAKAALDNLIKRF